MSKLDYYGLLKKSKVSRAQKAIPWVTIAPIIPWYEGGLGKSSTYFDFGHDVKMRKAHKWLALKRIGQNLGFNQQEMLKDTELCFEVAYQANSLGDPDPAWTGKTARSRQAIAAEKIMFANLALWLSKPSSIGFLLILHVEGPHWVWREASTVPRLTPHDRDATHILDQADLEKAKDIFNAIINLPRKGSVWVACHTLWTALTQHVAHWSVRYLILWICLEALFGGSSEITYKISQRLAFFLEADRKKAKVLFTKAKRGYKCRSEIAHGMNISAGIAQDSEQILHDSEWFVREGLKKILLDKTLTAQFNGSNKVREQFLEDLVFA